MTTYETIKITELPEITNADGTAIKVAVQSGETSQITKDNDLSSSISSDANNALGQGTDDLLYASDVNVTDVLTTKGDLIGYGTGYERLPVGTDDQILAANSSEPLGVKWVDSTLESIYPNYLSYSVNRAYTDANGYADYINKVSDTEVSFDIDDGTTYSDLLATYPDGSQETFTSLANITGISSDGTYTFIQEKGVAQAIATLSIVTESYTEPTGSSSGDYWLDISQKPCVPKKYNGTSWATSPITQFFKHGEATKSGGTLGTPVSYALNGLSITNTTIAIDNNYNIIHNLGVSLIDITGVHNNISGALTLSNGSSGYDISTSSAGTDAKGTSVQVEKNKATIRTGSTQLWQINNSGGVYLFTGSDLQLILRRAF